MPQTPPSRRRFLTTLGGGVAGLALLSHAPRSAAAKPARASRPDIAPAADPPVDVPCLCLWADPALDAQPRFELGQWWGRSGSVDAPGHAFGGPDPCMEAVAPGASGRPGATLAGMRPREASSQPTRSARLVVGCLLPTSGDWTIVSEHRCERAWDALPASGTFWNIGASPRTWLRRDVSPRASRIVLEFFDSRGGRKTPTLTWTYGNTYDGVALPAPDAGVPIRERVTYRQATGKLTWWVERPGNDTWHQIGAVTLPPADRGLWAGVESVDPGAVLSIGSTRSLGQTVRGWCLYDVAWEVGARLEYDTENTITLNHDTRLGPWHPFAKWQLQQTSPFGTYEGSDTENAAGRGTLGWWRGAEAVMARPLDGARYAPMLTLDKVTRTKMSRTEDAARDIATRGWSAGREIPQTSGGTRTGTEIFHDFRPLDHEVRHHQKVWGGPCRFVYQHNSNSELTGGGPSPWRDTDDGGKGKKPTTPTYSSPHPNTHPQSVAGGVFVHADLCVNFLHRIRQGGGIVPYVLVGTEVSTPGQFAAENRDDDHWEIYAAVRDAVRHYARTEMGDPDAVEIILVGYGGWNNTNAVAETSYPAILRRAKAAGQDPVLVDVHYNQGPQGFRFNANRARRAKVAAGLTPTLSLCSTEDYTTRGYSWRLGPSPLQGATPAPPPRNRDIRTCAEPTHLGAFGLFLRHHHAADASWVRFFSAGTGTCAGRRFDTPTMGTAASLTQADRWFARDNGWESGRMGVYRMLCMTGGTRMAVTTTGLSNFVTEAGVRDDGRLWCVGGIGRLAAFQVPGQERVTIAFGPGAARRAFQVYRVNSRRANYVRFDYGKPFDPAIHRLSGTPARADDAGQVVLTVEPAEVFLVLQDAPAGGKAPS